MSVAYKPIDGEQVSVQWYVALAACRAAGVSFNVNEGHRTMARQQYFWDLYRSGRGALAAVPSPHAPHIRTGRFDHAIDFNNAAGVMGWLRAHEIRCALTVPGESWHVEANPDDLARYHAAHRSDLDGRAIDVLGPTARRWAAEYLRLKADGRNRARRRVLRRVLIVRRKAEWVAARRGPKAGRKAAQRRYDALRKVTS